MTLDGDLTLAGIASIPWWIMQIRQARHELAVNAREKNNGREKDSWCSRCEARVDCVCLSRIDSYRSTRIYRFISWGPMYRLIMWLWRYQR